MQSRLQVRSCNPALWPKTGCEAVKERARRPHLVFEVGSGDRALDCIEGLAPKIAQELLVSIHRDFTSTSTSTFMFFNEEFIFSSWAF